MEIMSDNPKFGGSRSTEANIKPSMYSNVAIKDMIAARLGKALYEGTVPNYPMPDQYQSA